MTFINPLTKKTDHFWKSYFEDKKTPLPEGKPGINPGLLANSDKLKIIYNL